MAIHLPQSFTIINEIHNSSKKMDVSTEKLTSGTILTNVAEYPNLIQISENIDSFVQSSDVVQQGILDGISYSQTVEAGLESISDILNRGLELALNSVDGIATDGDRNTMQIEFDSVLNSIEDMVRQTEIFGRTPLSTAEADNLRVPVSTTFNTKDGRDPLESFVNISATPADLEAFGLVGADISTQVSAESVVDKIHAAIDQISIHRAAVGSAAQSELNARYDMLGEQEIIFNQTKQDLFDTDMAEEITKLTVAEIKQNTAMAMHQQAMGIQESFLKLL